MKFTNFRQLALCRHLSTTRASYSEVRVRFAPSPTGHLHLGGLRTALYNYLFAKQNNGSFILRIEDTDLTRFVPGASDAIEDHLYWAGLKPDESPRLNGPYGPYEQSKRLKIYREHAEELVQAGRAYRCFCSPERLELLRKHQARNREKPRYDGKCKHMAPNEITEKLQENSGHVIRFALKPGLISFKDLVFGEISCDLIKTMESDPVILKSDGFPTYHFANVVDDRLMKISHVLRGSEWIVSTSKHIQIYQSFGWKEPKYIHFPLITLQDGSKVSKRNHQQQLKSWIEDGYRPISIINFLTSSGGGVPKSKMDENELWTMDEFVSKFRFDLVTTHPASLDLNRLQIYSRKELIEAWETRREEIVKQFRLILDQNDIKSDLDDRSLIRMMDIFIPRVVTLNDLVSQEYSFVWGHQEPSWDKQEYLKSGWNLKLLVEDSIEFLRNIDFKDGQYVDRSLRDLAAKHGIERAQLMRFVRKLLTNSDKGLPVMEILECLGKKRTLEALKNSLKYVG